MSLFLKRINCQGIIAKRIRFSFFCALLIYAFALCYLIFDLEENKKSVKEEWIELSGVKYGLFNVDEWKKAFVNIITNKINEFQIGKENRAELKKKISTFLLRTIEDFESRFINENKGSLDGFFKNLIVNFTGTFTKMKESVPVFTDQILDFMSNPKNKEAVRKFLIDKVNQYARETFSETDYSLHDAIIHKYSQPDRASTILYLQGQLNVLQHKSETYQFQLILIFILFVLSFWLVSGFSKWEFVVCSSASFVFLIIGVLLPMIEIDARISSLKFTVLESPIEFTDQVLFYRSKSIVEVVKLMLLNRGVELILIGILIFLFSIIFPFSKIVSSVILSFKPSLADNKWIKFLVFKTGKWSMADVMVVAIFMAYIGFSGIVSDQLSQLSSLSDRVEILTTNQSTLQIGFYSFFCFVMMSLLLTNKLKLGNKKK